MADTKGVFPLECTNYNTSILVTRSKQNDLRAFEELIGIYQNRVYNLCYQLTGNYTDAQDLAQEVFIKAFSYIKTFKNQADFGTWLHRITVNTWINMQRKEKKHRNLSLDAPVQTDEGEYDRELPSLDATPLEVVESNEFNALVQKAMERLTSDHKAVLVLREIEGYTYEEIAKIMDCSIGTVRSRINRARKAMKNEVIKMRKHFEA